jgi:hypothetical protein
MLKPAEQIRAPGKYITGAALDRPALTFRKACHLKHDAQRHVNYSAFIKLWEWHKTRSSGKY